MPTPKMLRVQIRHSKRSPWTSRAMESAEPLPLPVIDSGQIGSYRGSAGPVVTVPSAIPAFTKQGTREPKQFQTSPVNDQIEQFPYSAAGKLFMQFKGRHYVASAWVIAKRGLFTAGHCAFDHDAGGAATNMIFCPAYEDGQTVGIWKIREAIMYNGWYRLRLFAWDMAALVTDEAISPTTGSLGFTTKLVNNAGLRAIGYPAQKAPGFDFDGERMWKCVGKPLGKKHGCRRMENNLTGGCSGGPWTLPAWEPKTYASNGLNSFTIRGKPNVMYSPLLDKRFVTLYKAVAKL